MFKKSLLTLALTGLMAGTAQAGAPDNLTLEKLWELYQAQQAELNALKANQAESDRTAQQAAKAADAAVNAAEAAAAEIAEGTHVSGGGWWEDTTVGGYAELHMNQLNAEDNKYDLRDADLHRFVVFLNHEFDEDVRMFSELEIEHGGVEADGDPLGGEVEVEQAYIEIDLNDDDSIQGKAGVMLIPVGLLNETHEPGTFYGVERNSVENVIIPTTWWAGGVGLSGQHANGFSWDAMLHTGIEMERDSTKSNFGRVRSGRQKISNALAEDLAATGRVKYTGMPGVEVAATVQYQGDVTQDSDDGQGEGLLLETHAVVNKGPVTLKALWAQWDIDGMALKTIGADKQTGWYIEPSYKVNDKLGVYVRHEDVEGGRTRDRFNGWEAGINYYPHEDVVLKADMRTRDHDKSADEGRDFQGFDLGVGWQF